MLHLWRQARPIIRHGDGGQPSASVSRTLTRGAGWWGGGVHGVLHQIDQHLLNPPGGAAQHHWRVWRVQQQLHMRRRGFFHQCAERRTASARSKRSAPPGRWRKALEAIDNRRRAFGAFHQAFNQRRQIGQNGVDASRLRNACTAGLAALGVHGVQVFTR